MASVIQTPTLQKITHRCDVLPRFLQRSGADLERNPDPPEAVHQDETIDFEELGKLSQADLLFEVVAQSRFVDGSLLPFPRCLGCEGPEEPEVQSIQQDDLFVPGAFQDGELPASDPVHDLICPLGKIGRGDSRHGS